MILISSLSKEVKGIWNPETLRAMTGGLYRNTAKLSSSECNSLNIDEIMRNPILYANHRDFFSSQISLTPTYIMKNISANFPFILFFTAQRRNQRKLMKFNFYETRAEISGFAGLSITQSWVNSFRLGTPRLAYPNFGLQIFQELDLVFIRLLLQLRSLPQSSQRNSLPPQDILVKQER